MDKRLQLQSRLEAILGSEHVYFQPPANVQMRYPAIVYARDYASTQFAENSPYRLTTRYMVTIIDRNPDSLIPDKVASLPMCLFSRHYASENLNHDVFSLYF
jgi:hypothetical protein